MFCNQCGKENPDNVVSCVHCGGPLATVPPMYAGQQVQGATPYAAAPPSITEPQTNGKATASLICGILSLTCFGLLTGIPAIILGHISKSEIRKSLGRMKGEGMALAGLIMGYISVAALPLVLIIAAIAIPNLLKSRIAANEASAVGSVRTILTASATYQLQKDTAASGFEDLKEANLIDPTLASGTKNGYHFTYTVNGDGFFVLAVPATPGTTGVRSFCAANDAVIRYVASNEECTVDSPPLQ